MKQNNGDLLNLISDSKFQLKTAAWTCDQYPMLRCQKRAIRKTESTIKFWPHLMKRLNLRIHFHFVVCTIRQWYDRTINPACTGEGPISIATIITNILNASMKGTTFHMNRILQSYVGNNPFNQLVRAARGGAWTFDFRALFGMFRFWWCPMISKLLYSAVCVFFFQTV